MALVLATLFLSLAANAPGGMKASAANRSQPDPIQVDQMSVASCQQDGEEFVATVLFTKHLTADQITALVGEISGVTWEWGQYQTYLPVSGGQINPEGARAYLKTSRSQLIADVEGLLQDAVSKGEPQQVIDDLKGQIESLRTQLEFLSGKAPVRFASAEVVGGTKRITTIKGGELISCVAKDITKEGIADATDPDEIGTSHHGGVDYRPYTGSTYWRPTDSTPYMANYFRWTPQALGGFVAPHRGYEHDIKVWPSAECTTVWDWDVPADPAPRTFECRGPVSTNVPRAQWYYDTRYLDPQGDWVEKDYTMGILSANNLSGYTTYHFRVDLRDIRPNLQGLIFLDRQLQGVARTYPEIFFCDFYVRIIAMAACMYVYQNEPDRMSFPIRGNERGTFNWP